MDKKFEFDRTVTVSIVTGVVVIVLYEYLRTWLEVWFTNTPTDVLFMQQQAAKLTAGILILLGALVSFIISVIRHGRKNANSHDSTGTNEKQLNVSSNAVETKPKRTKWKEILIVVLIVIVVAETIGFLLKPAVTLILDYDLFKQILIVIIPIIGAAMSAFKITNSWQIRKDKIEMKKTVLIAFKDSAKKVYNIQENFAIKLVTKYGTVVNKDKLIEKGTLEISATNFPPNSTDQPLLFFTKEYQEAQEDLLKARYDGSHFLTLLVLFYKNKQLKEKYLNVQRHLRDRWLLIEKMVNSKTPTDFTDAANDFNKKTEEIRDLLNDLEESLVSTPLYDIPI